MLGSMNPNFNPSNMVVPGIGGQGAFGPSGKAPSYMTTTNANMTGTQAAAPNSSQGSFLSSMFGQQAGIAGLQSQPLAPQQQLQQLQQQQPQQQQMQGMQTSQPQSNRRAYDPVGMQRGQQGNLMQQQGGQQFAPSPRDQMSDRDRFIEGQFQGNQDMPQAQIDAMRSQFGNTFDAQGRNPRPPKAEGLGVSNFVGASSNDMQRMLNRGSISGDNMGDAQRRMEQLRSNEFLAKMRAQNPERFNNPPPSAPPTDPRIFPTPPGVNPGLADGVPRQFPGLTPTSPSVFTPPPSSAAGTAGGLGGIMGQAPSNLTQYLEMMRSPMQQGGYGGPPAQAPQVNPMQSYGMMGMASPMQAQMSQMPEQIMQQGGYAPMQAPTGSQNSAPIASPFA